jgi:hypothetical protein
MQQTPGTAHHPGSAVQPETPHGQAGTASQAKPAAQCEAAQQRWVSAGGPWHVPWTQTSPAAQSAGPLQQPAG